MRKLFSVLRGMIFVVILSLGLSHAEPGKAELWGDLSEHYTLEQINEVAECLPELEEYLAEEAIESPKQALHKKMRTLEAEKLRSYNQRLKGVLLYSEMIRLWGEGLPNGYHDVAFGLKESRKLYEPILKNYSLGVEVVSASDVASSLSTFDQTRMRVMIAIMIVEMPEQARMNFLSLFVKEVSRLRMQSKKSK